MVRLLCLICLLGAVQLGIAAERGRTVIPDSTGISALAFTPDERQLVAIRPDELVVWNRDSGERSHRIGLQARLEAPIQSMRIAPLGKTVLLTHASKLSIIELMTGKIRSVPVAAEFGQSICLSPDGQAVLFVDEHQTLKSLSLVDGKLRTIETDRLLSGATELTLSPDHHWLVVSNRRELQWIEWKSGSQIRTVAIPDEQLIFSCSFDRTGRYLLGVSTSPRSWFTVDASTGQLTQNDAMLRGLTANQQSRSSDRLMAVTSDLRSKTTRIGMAVNLIDRATGRIRKTLSFPGKGNPFIALSDSSRYLAVATEKAVEILDLWKLSGEFADPDQVTEEMVREQWEHLTVEYHDNTEWSIRAMLRRPELTVRIFEDHIQPAIGSNPQVVRDLLNQLESKRFHTREKADRELRRIGDSAVGELRNRYRQSDSADLSQRIQRILYQIDQPILHGERLRRYRAVEVLERMQTPEAVALLKEWSRGDPAVLLTIESRQVLRRFHAIAQGK